MSEDGNDWRDMLPDDLKEAPALKDFKDIGSMAKSLIEAQSMVGNSRRVPKPDEAQEDIDNYFDKILNHDEVTKGKIMVKPDFSKEDQSENFFRTLGKPEKPEDYTIPDFGDDVKLVDDMVSSIKQTAHDLNLTDSQFQKYLEGNVRSGLANEKAANNAHNEDIKGLRAEWGHAFDERINDAVGFAEKTGAPEALKEVLKGGNADSETLKWLQGLAVQTGNEGHTISGQEGGARAETPNELQTRRSSLFRKMDELEKQGPQGKTEAREVYKEILEIGKKLQPESGDTH